MDGNTMAQTACKLNISKQDLKYHIGNLFAKIPEIRSVFPKVKQTLRKHQALHMHSKFEQKVKQPQQSFLPLG